MSTATKTRTEHQDPKAVYSEKELAGQQETLTKLREDRIPHLAAKRGGLKKRIAEAVAEGGDPEEARERLAEVETRLEEFRAAASLLEERLRDRRRRRVRHEAEARVRSIQKRIGGLAGEAPRRAEKARELAEKLAAQLEWLLHAPLRRLLLKREAGALADAFDLEVPDLRTFESDPREAARDARRTVRQADAPLEGLGLLDDPEDIVGVLGRLFDEDSPTPGLLDRLAELDAQSEGG